MTTGIIDIDADSITLLIYKSDNDTIIKALSKSSASGLVRFVESDALTPKGIRNICLVLDEYLGILHNLEIESTFIYASAFMKKIANANQVISLIRERTGLGTTTLTGLEMAELGYYGAAQSISAQSGVFVNIGSGSTEIAEFSNGNILNAISIPCGSLQLSLKYVKGTVPLKSHILSIKKEVLRTMKHVNFNDHGLPLDLHIAGGTAQAACKLYNDVYELEENKVMESEKLYDLLHRYNAERRDMNKRIKQLFPERIHTLIPGITILNTIAGVCQSRFLFVSSCGITEGYLLKHVLNLTNNRRIIIKS